MTQPKKNYRNSREKKNKNIVSSESPHSNTEKSADKEQNTCSNNPADASKNQELIYKVEVVNFPNKKQWHPRIANVISGLAFVINLILAIVTYQLFKTSVQQADISRNALKESKNSFDAINAPFIQVGLATVTQFEKLKPIEVDIFLSNLGNYPARIIKFIIVFT